MPQDITKAQDLGATLPKTPQYAPYRNNMMPQQMGYAPAPNVQRGVIDLDEPGHSVEPQNNYSQPKPPMQNKNHSGPVM